jgi:adenine-specific DNA-methyltransferase
MPPNPQRLELTWIGKENRPHPEPRILLEDPAKSQHAKHRTGKKDLSSIPLRSLRPQR